MVELLLLPSYSASFKVKTVCPRCYGSGEEPNTPELGPEEDCERCLGTGEVTIAHVDDLITAFNNLDTKLDALDTKLDTLDTHLDTIEAKIDALE